MNATPRRQSVIMLVQRGKLLNLLNKEYETTLWIIVYVSIKIYYTDHGTRLSNSGTLSSEILLTLLVSVLKAKAQSKNLVNKDAGLNFASWIFFFFFLKCLPDKSCLN